MPDTLPSSDALSAQDLSRRIYVELKPFVEEHLKGHMSIARDPLEIIEQLGQSPGSFRCILSWNGEKAQGHKDSGIVEHEWHVVVSHNRGLSIIKGANLFLSRIGEIPLIALAGRVRDRLRQLRFPAGITEERLTYAGSDPVAVDGTAIDAFTQTWKMLASLPPADA